MLIDRDVSAYLVLDDEPVEVALRRISANLSRIVFVVTGEGTLVGSLADGDFRRWVVDSSAPTLQAPSAEVAKRDCVTVRQGTPASVVDALFTRSIDRIPVLDERSRVVGVARPRRPDFFLDGRHLASDEPAFVIAEIGNNHNGLLDTAFALVDAAAAAGADCAKFQMRDMTALYRQGKAGFAGEDLGAQYTLDLLAEVSLSNDDLLAAMDHARSSGLIPLCTPWDQAAAAILTEYGVPGFKVASADLTNHDLIQTLGASGHPLIVSTGMSTEAEISEAMEVLRSLPSPYALLHCNSAYPAPFKDVNLAYMDRLAEIGDCLVGYSGHERGFHVPIAAVARGARIIEKHLTLDHHARGNDHKVSLEPAEFTAMVAAIRDVETAIGTKNPRVMSQGELINRQSLAKSLVAARDLPQGHLIAADDLVVRSPGRGLQPNARSRVVGHRTPRAIPAGDFIYESDLTAGSAPRHYAFTRPWGLPVRFHDYADLLAVSNPDFLEFHLSHRDLEVDLMEAFPAPLDVDFTVHSPDLFANDHLLDLASLDERSWRESIVHLQEVVDLTRALKPSFPHCARPIVIVSVGGASTHARLPESHRERLYARCAEALAEIDADGVELTAQTLPPLPWHVGGQRYWNLFVDPQETLDFCQHLGMRVTLDVSHTKLATNESGESFAQAMEVLLPLAAHLHLADAAGVDGEGLQIGEGSIDWVAFAHQLARLAPGVGFIPEIWQGHIGGGQGFWTALDRLEAVLA